MKNHYIFWSGGLDSTILLYELAKNSSKEHHVSAISFVGHPQINSAQHKCEKKARQKFMRLANKNKFHIYEYYINIDTSLTMYGCGPNQATVWLMHALPYIYPNSILHFGYIKSDDLWHSRHEFLNVIKSFNKLKNYAKKEQIKVKFDYEFTNKASLLRKAKDYKITNDMYWYCESPKKNGRKYDVCGTCECCLRHKEAEYRCKLTEISAPIVKGQL